LRGSEETKQPEAVYIEQMMFIIKLTLKYCTLCKCLQSTEKKTKVLFTQRL
jgi:hypothetical protein